MFTRGIRYMVLSGLAFTAMQLCVKWLDRIPAHEIILFRSLISLVLSLAALQYYKISPWGNNKLFLILRGIFGAGALTCFFITIKHMPLATAVIITHMSPIFTVIFAQYILKEKMKGWQWLFFLLAFAGVWMIKGYDERVTWEYVTLGVAAALFSGLAYNCVRKVKDTDHPVVVVFYFPLIATPIVGIYCFYSWITPQGWEWLLLILVGVFTQIAQVLMTMSLHHEAANRVSSIKYLGVVYALLLGYLFFDETYQWLSLAGMFLVILGVVLNTAFTRQKKATTT